MVFCHSPLNTVMSKEAKDRPGSVEEVWERLSGVSRADVARKKPVPAPKSRKPAGEKSGKKVWALGLGAAFYGHARAAGASPVTALAFTYMLLSMPLLNTHVALAGYADLLLGACYCAAIMAFHNWSVTREPGRRSSRCRRSPGTGPGSRRPPCFPGIPGPTCSCRGGSGRCSEG